MAMSIKKCLWELRTMRAGIKCGLQYADNEEDKEINREQIEALQMAIDTMRKYQEIQEIVENRNIKPPLTTLNRIIEVVENRK